MRKRVYLLPVLALMMLSACETVQGVGRDVQSGGAALSDSSRQVQSDL
jgi:predicted small secreted protein